ncbi:MAG: hypothetical protein MUO19_08060 [Dehalococcoidales bacterium]|nr:hypothetical protein [Dehalococcoidales bacterium]
MPGGAENRRSKGGDCLTMLDDGLKEKGAEETCAVKDLSELVAEALDGGE